MGVGGIPVVLMMSQRTCWAPPGAAEANVVSSINAAPNAKTVPSLNRLLPCMFASSSPFVHS
jgi:hypothetical protein